MTDQEMRAAAVAGATIVAPYMLRPLDKPSERTLIDLCDLLYVYIRLGREGVVGMLPK